MADTFTSIENQITKLIDRGMFFDLENDKIKEILLDIGYYRLGFYWYPFEIDENHNFVEGTKISTVIDLYYLDVDLRYLLIKYINRLELNFRTNLIYWVSMHYNNNSIWYTDPAIMSEEYLKDIKSHYNNNFKKKNIQICKHHQKYPEDKYAPCWKTFEYYTFGSIVKVYPLCILITKE
ncbi:Abi family protein [Empedobacter falsenii]|uniref:Abi family protein n=1 Tax=Empedobacter falsenii TaxID=343874 RepID=UPI00214CE707|nr:Abi family protein [Empedobacter falsenii]